MGHCLKEKQHGKNEKKPLTSCISGLWLAFVNCYRIQCTAVESIHKRLNESIYLEGRPLAKTFTGFNQPFYVVGLVFVKTG